MDAAVSGRPQWYDDFPVVGGTRRCSGLLGHWSETHPLLTDQPQGFFFELFGVTSSLWHNTPPRAFSRFSDASTISGIDQCRHHRKFDKVLVGEGRAGAQQNSSDERSRERVPLAPFHAFEAK